MASSHVPNDPSLWSLALRAIIVPLLLLLAAAATAEPGARVDNFALLDQLGRAHELADHADAAAIVIMVHGNGCPIVRNALPTLAALRDAYAGKRVEFLLLNANLQDDRAAVAAEAKTFGIEFSILLDETQLVGESLGLERTGEVLLIDPRTLTLIYRGPLDDRLDYGAQKAQASAHYLRDALDDLLAGRAIAVPQRRAVGCLINFPERARKAEHARISYARTVAPLLQEKCVPCHRVGGIGPWAMDGYDTVRGYSLMMREVVRTRRMPPWHADPHGRDFAGNLGLTNEQTRTLVHWIEAGAPRDEGNVVDPLRAQPPTHSEWELGEPDLVVTLPVFDVPASGVVNYQFPTVESPLERDVWVRAAQVLPGERRAVHHVIGSFGDADVSGRLGGVFGNHLATYAPGTGATRYPDDTGVLMPAKSRFVFQMHYTPFGVAARDVTRIGLYFHERPPAHALQHGVIADLTIRIPPGAREHRERAYRRFEQDVILYSVFPHAHFRGRSSRFWLRYPDGREETVLSVPRYDFNWQRYYDAAVPLRLPAGTLLVHDTIYDNSARQRANPDPTRAVPWGVQSYDEMLYGGFTFRNVDQSAPLDAPLATGGRALLGMLDDNVDGKLQSSELKGPMAALAGTVFNSLDRNGDGGVDAAELRFMPRQRRDAF